MNSTSTFSRCKLCSTLGNDVMVSQTPTLRVLPYPTLLAPEACKPIGRTLFCLSTLQKLLFWASLGTFLLCLQHQFQVVGSPSLIACEEINQAGYTWPALLKAARLPQPAVTAVGILQTKEPYLHWGWDLNSQSYKSSWMFLACAPVLDSLFWWRFSTPAIHRNHMG